MLKRQTKNYMKYDTAKNYTLLPIGSTVAVQRDSNRWAYGTIVGKGDYNHNNQPYIIAVTKTGRTVTRNSKHIKANTITAEQYLWDQLDKYTKPEPVEEFLKQY